MTNFLNRADDEFARAEGATGTVWARFFSDVETTALTGMAYLALSYTEPAYVEPAGAPLTQISTARNADMARSHTLVRTALATACLRDGDINHGVRFGWQAVAAADELRSVRVNDRLQLLADALSVTVKTSSDTADLSHHLKDSLPTY
jgi:hypothetical protein